MRILDWVLARMLWAAITLALPLVLAATAGAKDTVQVSQLTIEFGKNKPKSKHKKMKVKCLEMAGDKCLQHKREDAGRHSGHKKRDKDLQRELIEQGAGIIIQGIISSRTREQEPDPGAKTTAKKKNKPVASKPREKKKPKPVKKPPKQQKPPEEAAPAKPPEEKPVFVPPEFPVVAQKNCDDCEALWDSILRYEEIIGEDARRLHDRRTDVEARKAELADLQSKLPRAGSVDKVFYSREIERLTESIAASEELNDDLETLIIKEWAILRDRIKQHEDCVKRHCPVPVAMQPPEPETPASAEAPPEETITAAPEKKPFDYEWSTTIKPGLSYKGTGTEGSGTSTPPTASPEPPDPFAEPPLPASYPPDDDRKICGPDITPAVIATLRKIMADYNNNPDEQESACRSLIDPRTGGTAWDIVELSPRHAVPQPLNKEDKPYVYEKKFDAWVQRTKNGNVRHWRRPWFTPTSNMCAIPRADPVCAPTVEFFGICEHAQVVNYIQWKFMMRLCGGVYPLAGPALHGAWNMVQYGNSAPRERQSNMSDIAGEIFDKLEDDPDSNDFSDIAEQLKELHAGVQSPVQECALSCGITIDKPFDYVWTGLTDKRPYDTVRLDKDANNMIEAGEDMVRTKTGITATDLRPGRVLDRILKSLGLN